MVRVKAGGTWLDDLVGITAAAFFDRVPYNYRGPASVRAANTLILGHGAAPCYACGHILSPVEICVQVPSRILDQGGCCVYLVLVHWQCWEDAGGYPC